MIPQRTLAVRDSTMKRKQKAYSNNFQLSTFNYPYKYIDHKKTKTETKQGIKQGRYKSHSEHTKIMNQTNYNVLDQQIQVYEK